jgi:dUTPase
MAEVKLTLCSSKAIKPSNDINPAIFDIFCIESMDIEPGKTGRIQTHVSFHLPPGMIGRMMKAPHCYSDLIIKTEMIMNDWVIVIEAYNPTKQNVHISKNNMIGRLVLERLPKIRNVHVKYAFVDREREGDEEDERCGCGGDCCD